MSILGIVVTAFIAILTAWVVSYVDDWSRDWTMNVAETSLDAKDTRLRPMECSLSPQRLADEVLSAVASLPRWTVDGTPEGGVETPKELVLKLVHSTLLMQFKDDVTVTIRGTEQGSTLNARSQSRIGQGDLGQNPRNLRQLMAAVRRELERKKEG